MECLKNHETTGKVDRSFMIEKGEFECRNFSCDFVDRLPEGKESIHEITRNNAKEFCNVGENEMPSRLQQ